MAKKDVAILEGDKSRLFKSVECIQTEKDGGGSVMWIPEGHRKLTTLRINNKLLEDIEKKKSKIGTMHIVKKQGNVREVEFTFVASDQKDSSGESYYGFSKVTVSLKSKKPIVGKKKNDPAGSNANEHAISTDVDGNVVDEVIPSKIKITTLPKKQKYKDKEKIDIDGIVVKAYMNDGSIWDKGLEYAGGVIPQKYLKISPSKASRKEAEKDYATTDFSNIPRSEFKAWSSKTKNYPNPLNSGEGFSFEFDNGISEKRLYKYFDSDTQRTVLLKSSEGAPYASGHCLVVISETKKFKRYVNNEIEEWDTLPYPIEIDGKKYYYYMDWVSNYDSSRKIKNDGMKNDVGALDLHSWSEFEFYDIALILFSGRRTEGMKQTITVTWERPQDGKPLTDTFKVAVAEEKPKEDDDNGNGYEGYPTH